jgi:predicted porin
MTRPARRLHWYIPLRDDKSQANRNASQIGLGYLYSISKRTTLYTSYGYMRNRNGTAYTVGSAIETGSGSRALAAGVRHTF